MQRLELLRIVRALLDQPTAPFHEDAVRNAIVAELQECAHVRIAHDAYGNMIARYRRGTRRRPRWAFAAHMDHPGWVRSKDGDWRFLGSVAERFLVNPRKREFGDFAMWDLPAFELKDGQIHSRACDDLLGCAEIICLFRELEAANADVHCLGIFTRAEEVGFGERFNSHARGFFRKTLPFSHWKRAHPGVERRSAAAPSCVSATGCRFLTAAKRRVS